MVRMKYDGIEQPIEVAEVSVKAYERMGWKVVGDQPASTDNDPSAARGRRREKGES